MAINIDIIATLKGLQNLLKVEKSMKKLALTANKGFGKATQKIRQMNGALTANNKFLSRSADRVGFMAFQFTFLEGIAQRVLQSIKRAFTETLTEGAKGVDAMVRAVSQSGIDITGNSIESAKAIQFLNDALLNLGGGDTIFNVEEVSNAMKEIGKATTLTGTAMQQAQKLTGVTTQVLRLMTIEEVDAAEAAKGLIKTMNNFGLGVGDATKVINTLINVNQGSAITLDELTRSMAFASSGARDLGLDITQTAALLGLLGNRVGQGAGAVGRNFRQLTAGLKANALKGNPLLDMMDISLLDEAGNIKPFLQFLDETRGAFKEAGQSSDAFKLALQQALGLEIRAGDLLSKLLDISKEEMDKMMEAAKSGDTSLMEEMIGKSPESSIKKLNAAVGTLRVMFAAGLAPALHELVDIVKMLVRDTGLQEMMAAVGSEIGVQVLPKIKMLAKVLKKITGFFREHTWVLSMAIQALIVFTGAMITLFIVASIGKVFAAFISLILKMTLLMGPGTAATTAFGAGMSAIVWPMLAVIAVFAGIIIAALAFKRLFEVLTDDIPNDMQQMEIATTGSLVAIGVAMAALLGGPAGLAAALIALAAVAVAKWYEQIGALDAFTTTWDEVMAKINDEDLEGLDAMLITFQAWSASMEAAGFVVGEEIGGIMFDAIAQMKADLEATDFGLMWGEFEAGNITEALRIGGVIATNLTQGFAGMIQGVLGITTASEVAGIPDAVMTEATKAGIAAGENLRNAFIEGFTTNLMESIINAISAAFGPFLGPHIKGMLMGFKSKVDEKAAQEGIANSDLSFDQNQRFPSGRLNETNASPLDRKMAAAFDELAILSASDEGKKQLEDLVNSTNNLTTVMDGLPMKMIREGAMTPPNEDDESFPITEGTNPMGTSSPVQIFDENGENPLGPLTFWAEETVAQAIPMNETIVKLGEEVMPIMQQELTKSTEGVVDLTSSVLLLNDGTDIHTQSTLYLTQATDIQTIMSKILTNKYLILHDIMDEATLQLALETNQIVLLQQGTNNASIALTKIAIEGTEAARRLASLRVSRSGSFSISGRQTNTSFGEIGSLQQQMGKIIGSQVGEAINIAQLQQAQAATTLNVGGINIVIEGNADEETLQNAIDELQDRLNKEIGNKNTILAVRG